MRACVSVVLCLVVVATAGVADAAKKKPKPPACSGRFVVEGDRLFGGGGIPADAVIVAGTQVSTDGGCGPVQGKIKSKKTKTIVKAKFPSCTGLTGSAVLTAKIDAATCTTAKGAFRAKKAKVKRKFTARVPEPPGFTRGPYTPVALSIATIGPEGGTLAVTDASSPLFGLEIVVPPSATAEPITFEVAFADVQGESGLPAGASSSSKMIRISTVGSDAWNAFRMFDRPIRVTLPYVPPAEGEDTVAFYVVRPDGVLEPAGQDGPTDMTGHRIAFLTRTFADTAPTRYDATGAIVSAPSLGSAITYAEYVAVGLGTTIAAALAGSLTIDTGFLPSINGWFIPNYGSYYKASRGGNCFGFVGAAKYYFRRGFTPKLYSSYRDPQPTDTWIDDVTAVEFTSRVHNGLIDIWDSFGSEELDLQTESSSGVVRSLLGGLYVTGHPVLLYIQQKLIVRGVAQFSGAHAISFYRADIANGVVTFHVYDPNFPGADARRVTYTTGTGFTSYLSGTDAGSSRFQYNFFKHVGFYVGMTDAELDAIKQGADRGFADGSVFPGVTITSIVGANDGETATEGTTSQGEHKFVTADNAVTIRGTVLGGVAQDACCVVNNAYVFLSNKQYRTPINNQAGGGDGTFEVTVPVEQGENDFAILSASPSHPYTQWAGFFRDVIESTHSPAALTVTLDWGQGLSDVDLYVKEPDRDGKTGDTVYFAHRAAFSPTNPYLDFDNTAGFGPEHYIALDGMKTLYTDASEGPNLYGDYTVKVHYYGDHDDDFETIQPIGWSLGWRYLAFCPDPCTDPEATGIWVEGGAGGGLSADRNAGTGCCNIDNSGPDWSEAITISYPQPDPNDYIVPPSHDVMLP
jgi:uncharacterized protein YfaP (DUF2135 family)